MPSRAFFVFFHEAVPSALQSLNVAMPSRAFFVFLPPGWFVNPAVEDESQCPRGHSLFFFVHCAGRHNHEHHKSQCPRGHSLFFFRCGWCARTWESRIRRNALAGILCFSSNSNGSTGKGSTGSRNALAGILCFSSRWLDEYRPMREVKPVAMPSRAFFVFLHAQRDLECGALERRNALAGILCFSSNQQLDSSALGAGQVAMPSRAFFVFLHEVVAIRLRYRLGGSRNALAGILCFSSSATLAMDDLDDASSQCPRGHSLFFFRTKCRRSGPRRFGRNALAGILCFSSETSDGTKHEHYESSQCPRGHSLFFFTPPRRLECRIKSKGRNALAGILCFSSRCILRSIGREDTTGVAMPSRAFFVFLHGASDVRPVLGLGRNALAGILCFSSRRRARAFHSCTVAMPSRAFFVFLHVCGNGWHVGKFSDESQCPRGHSLFFFSGRMK